MAQIKPFAFVLMPFSSDFDDVYKLGIKSVADELGVVAERVDEQHFSETMLERIYRQIEQADFIIADMTGKNANVFYEVGYAHAKGKLCALITREASDIPFDLQHHAHVVYGGSVSGLREKLRPKLQWLLDESQKAKERIFDVTSVTGLGYLKRNDHRHLGTFDLEITIRNRSSQRSPEIEAIYIIATPGWMVSIDGRRCDSDDYKDGPEAKRKSFLQPTMSRLSPSAFMKLKPEFEREFWNKYNGAEEREVYSAKGIITLEIVTSEGTFEAHLDCALEFSEISF